MLLVTLHIALWIPAIAGWGLPWLLVRRRLAPGYKPTYDLVTPAAGLALLTGLTTLVNFFAPISLPLRLTALVLGWLGFGLSAARQGWPRPSRPVTIAGLFWLVALSVLAARSPYWVGDTGFYHLTTIRWIESGAVPLGLGNLFSRLAFNASWFQLGALMDMSEAATGTVTSLFTLAPAATWFVCVAASAAAHDLVTRRRHTREALFLAATLLPLTTLPNMSYLPSVSPDWAIFLLAVTAVGVTIAALEGSQPLPVALAALAVVCVLAVTVKLSAAALFLLPAALLVLAARWQQLAGMPWRWRAAVGVVSAVLVMAPWMARGVRLSGCLAYPAPSSCLEGLRWHIPLDEVALERDWIYAWARTPNVHPREVLGNWAWLGPWAIRTVVDPQVFRCAGLVVLGLALRWAARRAAPSPSEQQVALGWVGLPLLGGLAYWFFTAPGIRFGFAYLWCLALWVLAAGLHQAGATAARTRARTALRWLAAGLLGLLLGRNVWGMGQTLMTTQPTGGLGAWLTEWPAVPDAATVTQHSLNGWPVVAPAADAYCWLAPLPCTPYLPEDLWVEADPAGLPRLFYRSSALPE